jgi:hypothetical protein
MKKALNLYTEVNNNRLWLLEGKITSREAREVVEKAMVFIDGMPNGEKKDVLTDMTKSLESMLDVTYVFWCKDGFYFEEDRKALIAECRANDVTYEVGMNPLTAAQAVWEKKGLKDDPFFPVDYFVA